MRTTLFLFSGLLLAFSIEWSPVVADASPEAIRDIEGDKLRSGVKYYILPVIRGSGGGLTLAANTNGSCPFDVVQERRETSNGFPVIFSPVNPKKEIVRVSTDLNIKFDAVTICVQSTVWKLGEFDDSMGQYSVTTGGVEGNPGPATLSNWFKVEKFGDVYKLVFCPTVCNFCKVICRDISIFIDNNGTRRLVVVLNEEKIVPFRVVFKKV